MSKAENPFRYFNSSPEVIRVVVMMFVRYPQSLPTWRTATALAAN
jgi:putative transposase